MVGLDLTRAYVFMQTWQKTALNRHTRRSHSSCNNPIPSKVAQVVMLHERADSLPLQYIVIYSMSIDNIVTCISITRLRLGKHNLKARISAEEEVNLLGNGMQTSVSAATNINKGIPVTTNKEHRNCSTCWLLFRPPDSYKNVCIRAFKQWESLEGMRQKKWSRAVQYVREWINEPQESVK
jgi:hypothetical protein